MQADLLEAMKARDAAAVAALRTALSAIANAEAVTASSDKWTEPVVGKSGDVPRRELTEEQVANTVRAEAVERRAAITEYLDLGLHEDADRLRAELAVLGRYL